MTRHALAAAVLGMLAATPQARATPVLVGQANFPQPVETPAETEYGFVRLILRGRGDIADACPDAAERIFFAEYDGELVVEPDGTFRAELTPFDPTVATPAGCPITSVRVERLDDISIFASVAGLYGRGWLTFQTLSAVDNWDLQNGDFGELETGMILWPSAG